MDYVFTKPECLADGVRGYDACQRIIIETAKDNGWVPGEDDVEDGSFEMSDNALEYLNTLCAPGIYVTWDGGDVLILEEDEMI